ncbi:diphosphomevalonate decarboxylase [Pelagirhabdus alkalitolerans]|uniref:diphosphomevalonate decarboxylase n=1 Tax=Pelagirhabdus alkalitolerans TaxID=1612202 RepID=A0A1G6JR88_9BACI|nr:diphosphomevalonate decarboxylase [Pelagirhabdus alkalitolerans]SDC20925.1 diphosphomevalonate decarboxylase [Pelagirhabdus alkalitolerans]
MRAKARAHTNIALIKYWGKRDEQLFLPTNSSLSMTLDHFYTDTTVTFDNDLKQDYFNLNNEQASEEETEKISRFLDKVRDLANDQRFARVDSINHVPTAAGFASSASGFAALAAAATKAIGLDLTKRELSQVARLGSGSASRSIYGGFVEWQKGEREDGSDCYALPVLEQEDWDLNVLSVEVTTQSKKVLSREGMKRTVDTSIFYDGWLKAAREDMVTLKQAITKRDFTLFGETLEANALKMHATTLGANPPFMYWQSATMRVMEAVQSLREQGVEAYYTIDAGPNVKVVCQPQDKEKTINALNEIDVVNQIYTCQIGPGIRYLDV